MLTLFLWRHPKVRCICFRKSLTILVVVIFKEQNHFAQNACARRIVIVAAHYTLGKRYNSCKITLERWMLFLVFSYHSIVGLTLIISLTLTVKRGYILSCSPIPYLFRLTSFLDLVWDGVGRLYVSLRSTQSSQREIHFLPCQWKAGQGPSKPVCHTSSRLRKILSPRQARQTLLDLFSLRIKQTNKQT